MSLSQKSINIYQPKSASFIATSKPECHTSDPNKSTEFREAQHTPWLKSWMQWTWHSARQILPPGNGVPWLWQMRWGSKWTVELQDLHSHMTLSRMTKYHTHKKHWYMNHEATKCPKKNHPQNINSRIQQNRISQNNCSMIQRTAVRTLAGSMMPRLSETNPKLGKKSLPLNNPWDWYRYTYIWMVDLLW